MSNVKKNSKGKIDRVEAANWIIFTLAYAIFIGFLYGYVSTEISDIIYVFNMPFDAQQSVIIFALAMWGIISLFMNIKFRRD